MGNFEGSEEEDGCVIEDPIPVSLFSVELEGKATRVTSTVGRALLTADGGEASNAFRLLAQPAEHVNGSQVGDVVRNLELAICSGTFRMDNALGDSLAIEVGEKVNQVEVLQQEWAILADTLTGLGVHHRAAIAGSIDGLLVIPEGCRSISAL